MLEMLHILLYLWFIDINIMQQLKLKLQCIFVATTQLNNYNLNSHVLNMQKYASD